MKEHECIIGHYDERLLTLKDLLEIVGWHMLVLADGEVWKDFKFYTLKDYCDMRKSTDLSRFKFCPYCGKKIDWKKIKRENDTK
jgi:hypothetical protein